ncbi:uncharacterized protein LOC134801604 [Cydia splendana]|uniref:uncharacterized protein LOC134801604 n=1 Tax=Cydia splendana TaxID=1100963 RepID=UPI00300CCD9A
MPLPFNKSLDLKLLALVKENSILYNTKHPRYLDFDAREVVWQKIGDALNRSDQVCKARWINIRDMMRRKIRERLRNPQHRSYNYKYEEEMSFMIPYFKDSNTSNEEYTDFIEEVCSFLPLRNPFDFLTILSWSSRCNYSVPFGIFSLSRKICERLWNPQHRSYNYKYEEEMSLMIPYFKDSNTRNEEYTDFIEEDTPCDDISPSDVFADVESYQPKESKPVINTMKPKEDFQNQFQDLNPTDPIDVFLITIGSTLRRFSPYYLNQAKSKIFQVVQDYELQQIMNKDDNLNASSSDAR